MAEPTVEPKAFGRAASDRQSDARTRRAWREWLTALATDAEAALAAALAYRELDPAARESWLDALEQDARELSVPRYALYAPLLAVETDPERRAKLSRAAGKPGSSARLHRAALSARTSHGEQITVLIVPLYLDFVQVLACAWKRPGGFSWVRHDPIVESHRAPQPAAELAGARLEPMPFAAAIDELALAVLAHQRTERPLPDTLRAFADLFEPCTTQLG